MTEATRTLRIAMLAPISWPVPPEGYGPWEKVVWSLTDYATGFVTVPVDDVLAAIHSEEG